jgi:hypothetical protein
MRIIGAGRQAHLVNRGRSHRPAIADLVHKEISTHSAGSDVVDAHAVPDNTFPRIKKPDMNT